MTGNPAVGRRRKGDPVHGWLVVDKPEGLTSTQVVSKVRRLFNAAKAGHGGTLDPIATGILPIAFGEATKTVSYAMDGRKTYRFTVRWGESRDTDDREGVVTATGDKRPSREEIEAMLPRFTGEIVQTPPAFSAIKVYGERAYDLARDGEKVELKPRLIRIDSLRLVDMPDADTAVFEAESGKGAYMRALARDFGVFLGAPSHLTAIRRTAVGPFTLDDAVTLEHIEAAAGDPAALESTLLPIETPLDDIPAVALTEAEAHRMRCGQPVTLLRRSDRERLESLTRDLSDDDVFRVVDTIVLAVLGDLPVALARVDGAELHPVRVLNLA